MSIIKIFFNPLDGEDQQTYEVKAGTQIIDFLQDKYPLGFDGLIRVFVGNEELQIEDLDTVIGDEEKITILVMPSGGAILTTIGSYALQAVVAVAVGYVVNLIFAPKVPGALKQEAESPTYSIGATQNQARLGDVIPVGYGTVIWPPDYAAAPYSFFLEGSNDQFVDELLCLGHGSWDIEQIYIGNIPITSLEPGAVQFWKFNPWDHQERMGIITDKIADWVANTNVPWAFREDVFTSPAVEAIDFLLDRSEPAGPAAFAGICVSAGVDPVSRDELPGYLSGIATTLGIRAGDTITLSGTLENDGDHKIKYVTLDPSNSDLMTVYESSDTPVKFADENPASGTLALNAVLDNQTAGPFRAQPDNKEVTIIECDIIFPNGLYRIDSSSGNVKETNVIVDFIYQPIDPDTGEEIGLPYEFQRNFIGKQRQPYRSTITTAVEGSQIPTGSYDVYVRRVTPGSVSSYDNDEMQWVGLKGILAMNGQVPVYHETTLLAIRIKATAGLGPAARSRVRVKANKWLGNKADGTRADSSNPIEVIKDIWKKEDYGMNLPLDELDLPTMNKYLEDWYALDGAPSFNGMFDQRGTGFDAMQQVASLAAGQIIQTGGLTTIVVEGTQPVRTAMFTSANIVKDSLSIQYSFDTTNEYDSIQIEYRDANSFQPKFVTHPENGTRPDTYQLFGCTDDIYATEYAIYMYNIQRLRRKQVKFTTELDGLIPIFGDRIAVSSPMAPDWGISGVIVDVIDGFTLRVDRQLDWAPSPTVNYMMIRFPNGVPSDSFAVSRGSQDNIVVSSIDLSGVVFDAELLEPTNYVFGTNETITADFMLSKSKPVDETHVELVGQTYTAAIYDGAPPHMGVPRVRECLKWGVSQTEVSAEDFWISPVTMSAGDFNASILTDRLFAIKNDKAYINITRTDSKTIYYTVDYGETWKAEDWLSEFMTWDTYWAAHEKADNNWQFKRWDAITGPEPEFFLASWKWKGDDLLVLANDALWDYTYIFSATTGAIDRTGFVNNCNTEIDGAKEAWYVNPPYLAAEYMQDFAVYDGRIVTLSTGRALNTGASYSSKWQLNLGNGTENESVTLQKGTGFVTAIEGINRDYLGYGQMSVNDGGSITSRYFYISENIQKGGEFVFQSEWNGTFFEQVQSETQQPEKYLLWSPDATFPTTNIHRPIHWTENQKMFSGVTQNRYGTIWSRPTIPDVIETDAVQYDYSSEWELPGRNIFCVIPVAGKEAYMSIEWYNSNLAPSRRDEITIKLSGSGIPGDFTDPVKVRLIDNLLANPNGNVSEMMAYYSETNNEYILCYLDVNSYVHLIRFADYFVCEIRK